MLSNALGGLVHFPQWFTWRLEWDDQKSKFLKTPCYPDGSVYRMDAQAPENWREFADAYETTQQLDMHARITGNGRLRYALGFMLTKDCGYWFFDVDNVTQEVAQQWWQFLPGAFFEWSSSGRGVHFIGRGAVPEHACKNTALGMEFYTEGRGIAFGLDGQAYGCADTDLTVQAWTIAAQYFAPTAQATAGDFDHGPRADWDGPTDDSELIAKALRSRSAASMFGARASFSDLWTANARVLSQCYPDSNGEPGAWDGSSVDAALASHLAFWTGCDAPRIERLMRQSALARPKWDEHRTYLYERTIYKACAQCREVYSTPKPEPAPVAQPQATQLVEAAPAVVHRDPDVWIQRVLNVDSERELIDEVMPAIARDDSLDVFGRRKLEPMIRARFADFLVKVTDTEIRKHITPEKLVVEDDRPEDFGGLPAWANHYVYVTSIDSFYNKTNGEIMSREGFRAVHNRYMPKKSNGDCEDAAKWCLERWNMATVEDTLYRPQMPDIFCEAGRWYANEYVPTSVPQVAASISPEVRECIELFWAHMNALTGQRAEVRDNLFYWLLHNVKKPGVKIRWSPLVKGVQGDGKSLLLRLLIAVMGSANAQPLSASAIRSEYNDWATGAAVRGVEEIMMTGRRRHEAANDFKTNITEDDVFLNRKGRVGITVRNTTNYIAFTNHSDAVPIEDGDRRWFIVFTPWRNIHDAAKAMGLHSARDVEKRLGCIVDSIKRHPAEWRKWLLDCELPADFNPNGRAPETSEKKLMKLAGEDEHHAMTMALLEDGAVGITPQVVSSAHLTRAMMAMCARENLDAPKTNTLVHLMTRLGFVRGERFKWGGEAVRCWVKNPEMSKDAQRAELDKTLPYASDAMRAFGG